MQDCSISIAIALEPWAPSQYPIRRLSVRSRKVSKPRDLYLELSDRSEIWQALRQHGCRCACQISKRCNNLKHQSRDFETSRDLTKRRLFVYWDGALQSCTKPSTWYQLQPIPWTFSTRNHNLSGMLSTWWKILFQTNTMDWKTSLQVQMKAWIVVLINSMHQIFVLHFTLILIY